MQRSFATGDLPVRRDEERGSHTAICAQTSPPFVTGTGGAPAPGFLQEEYSGTHDGETIPKPRVMRRGVKCVGGFPRFMSTTPDEICRGEHIFRPYRRLRPHVQTIAATARPDDRHRTSCLEHPFENAPGLRPPENVLRGSPWVSRCAVFVRIQPKGARSVTHRHPQHAQDKNDVGRRFDVEL